MHARGGVVFCPECGSQLADEEALEAGARLRRAGRVTAARCFGGRVEESPDTAGQDAGARPGGESRRKVEQKGDRLRRVLRRRRR